MFQLLWIGLSDRWIDVRSVWPFPWTEIKKIVKGVGRSLAISSFKYPIRIQSSAVWPFKYLTVINTSDSLKIETYQIIFFGKKTPIEHATSIFKQFFQMMKCFNIYFLIEINSGQGTNHQEYFFRVMDDFFPDIIFWHHHFLWFERISDNSF